MLYTGCGAVYMYSQLFTIIYSWLGSVEAKADKYRTWHPKNQARLCKSSLKSLFKYLVKAVLIKKENLKREGSLTILSWWWFVQFI